MNVIVLFVILPYVSSTSNVTLEMTAFQKSANSRYLPTVSTTAARSSEDCLYECVNSKNCEFANYHHGLRTCELCARSPTGAVTNASPEWVVFFQDIPVPDCNASWAQHDSSCYSLIKQRLTWDQAQAACGALIGGARLAEPKTQPVIDFLKATYLADMGNNENVWTGGKRSGANSFIWTDVSPVSMDFGWPNDQPDNNNGDEDCIHAKSLTFLFNDAKCSETAWSVCEYERI